jgi:hypothetical protein
MPGHAPPARFPKARNGEKAAIMKKNTIGCFLCKMPAKGRKFTFYSGVKIGGSTTQLQTHFTSWRLRTRRRITVLENWHSLMMHEIAVCRWCQLRAWRKKQLLPMILNGVGACVLAFLALLSMAFGLVMSSGLCLLGLPFLLLCAAVVPAGLCALHASFYFGAKPSHAQLEPVVLAEAVHHFPDNGRTFMTEGQYVARHERGAF